MGELEVMMQGLLTHLVGLEKKTFLALAVCKPAILIILLCRLNCSEKQCLRRMTMTQPVNI